MKFHRYPPEVHEFVKKNTPYMTDRELAEECNKKFGTEFTENGMKSFRGNHGYRSGRKKDSTRRYYPEGFEEYVRRYSKGRSATRMAEMVNKKFGTHMTNGSMKHFRKKRGISSGLDGRFNKGRTAPNKGKKLEEFMSPEAIERSRKSRFQKGRKPENALPIGTTVETKDGYLMIKVQETGLQRERWQFLHRKVWEDHNGKIPDGMMIIFKDRDKKNCNIENLAMVTHEEHAMVRPYRSTDPDITETAVALIRLKVAAEERRKNAKKSNGAGSGDSDDGHTGAGSGTSSGKP